MLKRIVTGFILLFIGLYTIYYGGQPLFIWLVIVSQSVTYELIRMAGKRINLFTALTGHAAVFLLLLSTTIKESYVIWTQFPVKILFLAVVLISVVELFRKKIWFPQSGILSMLRIILFVSASIPAIYLVRESEHGIIWATVALGAVVASDTYAYFGGNAFGARLLTDISPKKTWEGSFFGFVGAVLTGLNLAFLFGMNPLVVAGLSGLLSVVSQLGDLHESLTKRQFNVKDSSGLLPGHGGFYDRADSAMFVFPIVFLLI